VVQRQAIVHAIDVGMCYTTLSRCWGLKQSLVLKKSTSSRLQRGFPVEELPKTFREAVQLTQQLGVHYIWIDALCIFQDSGEDWRMEAATMSEVYSNSFLNIAASTAKDNDTGLFSAQHALSPMPFRTEVDLRLVRRSQEGESAFKGSYIVCDQQIFHEFLRIAPL
jgi:Heterokaryon incompatibility protein (HET)